MSSSTGVHSAGLREGPRQTIFEAPNLRHFLMWVPVEFAAFLDEALKWQFLGSALEPLKNKDSRGICIGATLGRSLLKPNEAPFGDVGPSRNSIAPSDPQNTRGF